MKLGVIGGLGPMATAYFMELITKMTKASIDQDHIEMIIYSKPQIPDRTSFILGQSDENPLIPINDVANKLVSIGADVIAIPCITAHCFHDKLCENVSAKILNAVDETADELKKMGVSKAGIMATSGTMKCGLFQGALNKVGIEPIAPNDEIQAMVMDIIYNDIKAGNKPSKENFDTIRDYFMEQGAQAVILGCTELSLLKWNGLNLDGFVDAMSVLAKASIRACGYEVKEGY
ncbi:MAG: amino acid racemase [Clostridia bacterium]|nr:amino acid racemase [Clostridia bacterium]